MALSQTCWSVPIPRLPLSFISDFLALIGMCTGIRDWIGTWDIRRFFALYTFRLGLI